jgi:hypothetical protein
MFFLVLRKNDGYLKARVETEAAFLLPPHLFFPVVIWIALKNAFTYHHLAGLWHRAWLWAGRF